MKSFVKKKMLSFQLP